MNELNDSDIWDTGTRIGFSAEDSARKLTVLFPEKTAPMQNVGRKQIFGRLILCQYGFPTEQKPGVTTSMCTLKTSTGWCIKSNSIQP